MTAPQTPGAPILDGRTRTATSFEVSWPAVPTATSYDLRVVRESDGSALVVSNAVSPQSVNGLQPDTSYLCSVRATNHDGSSAWSAASDRCWSRPQVPAAPTLVPHASGTAVIISWGALGLHGLVVDIGRVNAGGIPTVVAHGLALTPSEFLLVTLPTADAFAIRFVDPAAILPDLTANQSEWSPSVGLTWPATALSQGIAVTVPRPKSYLAAAFAMEGGDFGDRGGEGDGDDHGDHGDDGPGHDDGPHDGDGPGKDDPGPPDKGDPDKGNGDHDDEDKSERPDDRGDRGESGAEDRSRGFEGASRASGDATSRDGAGADGDGHAGDTDVDHQESDDKGRSIASTPAPDDDSKDDTGADSQDQSSNWTGKQVFTNNTGQPTNYLDVLKAAAQQSLDRGGNEAEVTPLESPSGVSGVRVKVGTEDGYALHEEVHDGSGNALVEDKQVHNNEDGTTSVVDRITKPGTDEWEERNVTYDKDGNLIDKTMHYGVGDHVLGDRPAGLPDAGSWSDGKSQPDVPINPEFRTIPVDAGPPSPARDAAPEPTPEPDRSDPQPEKSPPPAPIDLKQPLSPEQRDTPPEAQERPQPEKGSADDRPERGAPPPPSQPREPPPPEWLKLMRGGGGTLLSSYLAFDTGMGVLHASGALLAAAELGELAAVGTALVFASGGLALAVGGVGLVVGGIQLYSTLRDSATASENEQINRNVTTMLSMGSIGALAAGTGSATLAGLRGKGDVMDEFKEAAEWGEKVDTAFGLGYSTWAETLEKHVFDKKKFGREVIKEGIKQETKKPDERGGKKKEHGE